MFLRLLIHPSPLSNLASLEYFQHEGDYKRREQDQKNETEGEIQSLCPSWWIDKGSEETTIVGMDNDNLVDGNVSERDPRIIPLQQTMPQIEIEQHIYTTNISIQSTIEGREYRSNYQRAYRKRQHDQMNSIERESRRVNQNQQKR